MLLRLTEKKNLLCQYQKTKVLFCTMCTQKSYSTCCMVVTWILDMEVAHGWRKSCTLSTKMSPGKSLHCLSAYATHVRPKLSNPKKGLVSKPLIFKEFNSRCQVHFINMRSNPDGEFKFILNYQDHLTKFILLRALKSKRAEEVAY